jgi:hypothetical protein
MDTTTVMLTVAVIVGVIVVVAVVVYFLGIFDWMNRGSH